jgi:hypothetical protein
MKSALPRLCPSVGSKSALSIRRHPLLWLAGGERAAIWLIAATPHGQHQREDVTDHGNRARDAVVCSAIEQSTGCSRWISSKSCESSKLEVLRGGRRTLQGFRPVVLIETVNGHVRTAGRSGIELLPRFRNHPQSKSRLRFEETTQELIRFVAHFSPDQILMPDWQTIKPTVMSRIHYELALCYVAEGNQAASKGFQQFLESLSLDPLFALRYPILTAHIMKRVLTGRFKTIGGQITAS